MKYYFLTRYDRVLIYRDDGYAWLVKVVGVRTKPFWSFAAASKEYVKPRGVRICTAVKYLRERGIKITRAELIR